MRAQVGASGAAPVALAAGDARSAHDAIADVQRAGLRPGSNDVADELVAEDHGGLRQQRPVRPLRRIGATDRGPRHSDDHVGAGRVRRLGDGLDADVARSSVDGSFHAVWMWTLTLVAVSWAASSAASASTSGNRAVTIAVGSTTPLARKRIVRGHRPAEP